MPSSTAKRVLKNRPDLQERFDEEFETNTDPTAGFEARVSEALRNIRADDMGPKSIPGKSVGGEIEIKKGGDYIKDLL